LKITPEVQYFTNKNLIKTAEIMKRRKIPKKKKENFSELKIMCFWNERIHKVPQNEQKRPALSILG